MNQTARPFEDFLPGNHLILGEAGSGKTKIIWSILQSPDFIVDDAVNIVLTDAAAQRMWHSEKTRNPIRAIDPYDPDISWITQPSESGIYYCSCDYAPRVITFIECFATWAIRNQDGTSNKVRLFLDFSSKCWSRPEFVEQLTRLHYISTNQTNIEIWAIIGSFKKVSPQARSLFEQANLILTNPFPPDWINEICDSLGLKREALPGLDWIDFSIKEGFYYIPYQGQGAYLQK